MCSGGGGWGVRQGVGCLGDHTLGVGRAQRPCLHGCCYQRTHLKCLTTHEYSAFCQAVQRAQACSAWVQTPVQQPCEWYTGIAVVVVLACRLFSGWRTAVVQWHHKLSLSMQC